MKCWIAAVTLMCASVGFAAEAPATRPTTAAGEKVEKFPTPGELIRRIKDREQKVAAKPKVAYFDLARPVDEKPADFSLFGDDGATTLRSLVQRLHQARDD